MTIKLQDIYGLAKVKIGDLFSSPPAGTSQSITSGAPADVPLELTPAAGQTAALLKANGKDVIDSTGHVILPEVGQVTDFGVPVNEEVHNGLVVKSAKYYATLTTPPTALPEGKYILLVSASISSTGLKPSSGTQGRWAWSLILDSVPNTTLTSLRADASYYAGVTYGSWPYTINRAFQVNKGTTADFSGNWMSALFGGTPPPNGSVKIQSVSITVIRLGDV